MTDVADEDKVRRTSRYDRDIGLALTGADQAAVGGVLQDLFLWDLNEADPMQLTATGAAFGAEWLGTQALWRD